MLETVVSERRHNDEMAHVRNHGMSFRGIFNRYLASHPRNYSADFIPYGEENCQQLRLPGRCPGRIYCPTRREISQQKINIQSRATMLRVAKLFTNSPPLVTTLQKNDSQARHCIRLNDTVAGAKCRMCLVKL